MSTVTTLTTPSCSHPQTCVHVRMTFETFRSHVRSFVSQDTGISIVDTPWVTPQGRKVWGDGLPSYWLMQAMLPDLL